MSWRPLQIVAVALALITASSVCLGQCAAHSCHDISDERNTAPVPPCHKEQPTKPTAPSEQCNATFVFTENRTKIFPNLELQPVGTAVTDLAHSAYRVLPEPNQSALYTKDAPPSAPELVFSTVLRL